MSEAGRARRTWRVHGSSCSLLYFETLPPFLPRFWGFWTLSSPCPPLPSPLFFLLISAPLPSTLAISPHHAWNANVRGKGTSLPPYPPGFAVWHKIDLEQKALYYRSFSSCKTIQGRARSLSPTTCILNPASYVDLILQHPLSWLLPVTA